MGRALDVVVSNSRLIEECDDQLGFEEKNMRSTFRIKGIHIRDFRSITALDLEPTLVGSEGGMTVLAGDNGCGKTSVLEALLLVLGREELLGADRSPVEEQIRFGAEDFEVRVNLEVGASPISLRADLETLHRNPMGVPPGYLVDDSGLWRDLGRLNPSVEYFSARRDPESLGQTVTDDLRGAASRREARRLIELKRKLVNASRGKSGTKGIQFERLRAFLRPFLAGWDIDVIQASHDPGSNWEVVLCDRAIPEDVTSLAMARRLAPSRPDIPTLVPIDRLSAGQMALFAFASPILFRDQTADLILIDEPEKHMHVQWQRHILGALRNLSPESHFIVATHSLDVLDSVMSGERFHLERDSRADRREDI